MVKIRILRKQITFYGNNADSKALGWCFNLSKCFNIKKAIITDLPIKDWKGKKVRVVVRYD